MRFFLAVSYAIVIAWTVFSLLTFLYNWIELRKLESEIRLVRTQITVWKVDMTLMRDESKSGHRSTEYDNER